MPNTSIRPTTSCPGMMGRLAIGKFAIQNVQVGPAHAARTHLDPNFPGTGLPIGQLRPLERTSDLGQHHRFQKTISESW